MDIENKQRLERLKTINPAIDDDLFTEVLQISDNDLKIALDVLSIVKDCKNKEDMLNIIVSGKNIALLQDKAVIENKIRRKYANTKRFRHVKSFTFGIKNRKK